MSDKMEESKDFELTTERSDFASEVEGFLEKARTDPTIESGKYVPTLFFPSNDLQPIVDQSSFWRHHNINIVAISVEGNNLAQLSTERQPSQTTGIGDVRIQRRPTTKLESVRIYGIIANPQPEQLEQLLELAKSENVAIKIRSITFLYKDKTYQFRRHRVRTASEVQEISRVFTHDRHRGAFHTLDLDSHDLYVLKRIGRTIPGTVIRVCKVNKRQRIEATCVIVDEKGKMKR